MGFEIGNEELIIPSTKVPLRILKPAVNFNLNALWEEDRRIYEILVESKDIEEAREKLFKYLSEKEWEFRSGKNKIHPLVVTTVYEALLVFRNIISPINEKLTGYSALKYLWRVARGDKKVLEEIDEGFLLEFKHLFKAINGRPEVYPAKYAEGLHQIDFSKIHGNEAGIARSNYLDKLFERIWSYIKRYPSGLDEKVIEERKKNKQKILNYFGANEDDWQEYLWHFRHIIQGKKSLEILQDLVNMDEDDITALKKALEENIPFAITPYYLHLFDFESPYKKDYQVRTQVLPPLHTVIEMAKHKADRSYYFDFMGEHDTSPFPLITRRYPMVAILKASNTCPQICVYCQRNWEIAQAMDPEGIPTMKKIEKAIDWFAQHPAIKDVLVTGGDPFVLRNDQIERIVKRLSELEHVINIRLATRVIVTVPFRITDEVAEMIGSYIEPGRRNICVVTHVESAYEVTPEMAEAVRKIRKAGAYIYNQQVFTLWNSRRFETVALRMALKRIGIDPYYTFYPKGKWEHKEYVIPVARIRQERVEEARLLPGVFRTDEPVFNVPRLGKNHMRALQNHHLIMIRPDGRRVYMWLPWERSIQLTTPYIYTDIVSIRVYLEELKQFFNEDPEDYKSIWYYY